MSKTIQLSALFTATILVAGLIAVGFSDEAFAIKPDTKKVLIQVYNADGTPASGAFCTETTGFAFFQANNGGVAQKTVPAGQTTFGFTCIDTIDLDLGTPPYNAQVFGNIDLKDNGTTVVQVTLVPI